jgi:hypothetical protein
MNHPTNLKTTTLTLRTSFSPATAGRGSLRIVLVLTLVWLALLSAPKAFGVTPAPDGGYPNDNTAEGANALFHLTTGSDNTATGFHALFSNTTGVSNTATGSLALQNNTTGPFNTATGEVALFSNTTGDGNTATGFAALGSNTTGFSNTATGSEALESSTTGLFNTATGEAALFSNTTGGDNTATGSAALFSNTTASENTATGINALGFNTTGNNNTATGSNALFSNTTGANNTATGFHALFSNTTGNNNTAEGFQALLNSTGSNNIAVGVNAGINLTTGNNNIVIGASGTAAESNTIRIGKGNVHKAAYMGGISGATVASGVEVIVDTRGHLGTIVSSQRFKEAIKPMDTASEAILALEPVTFRYKHELDPKGVPQFGLVAEQVEKVNPDLVARDANGKVYTVRYEAVNAMLLNEFLKEHRTVQELKSTVAKQEATIAQQQRDFQATAAHQQKQIEALTATVQKVSDQIELSKPPAQMVDNNR